VTLRRTAAIAWVAAAALKRRTDLFRAERAGYKRRLSPREYRRTGGGIARGVKLFAKFSATVTRETAAAGATDFHDVWSVARNVAWLIVAGFALTKLPQSE
jgi:hypothetical protein